MKLSEKVQAVVDSDISAYALSQATGVPATTVQRVRQGNSEVGRMTIANGEKLAAYYDEHFSE